MTRDSTRAVTGLRRGESGFAAEREGQRGAVSLWSLLFLAVLLLAWTGTTALTASVTAADIDIQRALEAAAKAAAFQVSPASQADGRPRIDPDAAHQAFRASLAANLGLSEADLQPLPGSPLNAPPDYWLAVYNGGPAYGLPAGRIYSVQAGAAGEASLQGLGFPQAFQVGEDRLVQGAGTAPVEVVLAAPGVAALFRGRLHRLTGGAEAPAVRRWAAARLVCPEHRKDGCTS